MGDGAVKFALAVGAAIVLTAGSTLASGVVRADHAVLQAAEDAYAARDFAKVVEIAGTALDQENDQPTKVRYHYLLGQSLYQVTAADVKSCVDAGTLKRGFMRKDQADSMKRAQASFKAVFDIDQSSSMAPEALFMAGQLLDFGCLNHFSEAVEHYDLCARTYPDNKFGQLAQARLQKLKPKLEKGYHSPIDPPQR